MKKLLLILMVILTAFSMSACQEIEQNDPIVELETYDYYLLVVVSRERQSQDTFIYVLREVGASETADNITYESDKLWSVGEFVIAIEIDEKGNVYYTDLDATTSMLVNEQVEMQELYYELKLDYYEELYGVDLDDTPEDFVKFIYDNYRELYDYLVEKRK